MILFHETTAESAAEILRDGFCGGPASIGALGFENVVFLGARPWSTVNQNQRAAVALAVDVGDVDLTDYLIEEEGGLPPWEYVVPAPVLNAAVVSITVMSDDELDAVVIERMGRDAELGEP